MGLPYPAADLQYTVMRVVHCTTRGGARHICKVFIIAVFWQMVLACLEENNVFSIFLYSSFPNSSFPSFFPHLRPLLAVLLYYLHFPHPGLFFEVQCICSRAISLTSASSRSFPSSVITQDQVCKDSPLQNDIVTSQTPGAMLSRRFRNLEETAS